MKHEKKIIPSVTYYYGHWRRHSMRFILVLVLLSNAAVWGIVSALYNNAEFTIWLGCFAAFLTFVSVVEYKSVSYYYEKYQRSIPDQLPNDEPSHH